MVEDILNYFEEYPSSGAKSPGVLYRLHLKRLAGVSYEEIVLAHRIFVSRHPGLVAKRVRGYKQSRAAKMSKDLPKVPRVLIFDTETAPMVSYHFGRYNVNIGIDHTISEPFFLCWSAKWLYSNETLSDVVTPGEALNRDDKRIVQSLWKLLDEADIVVAHNAIKADVAWFNSRCLVNGLQPPSYYKVVDTLLVARKKFGFSSNKLDALAGMLGIDHKLDTDFGLWRRCMEGDPEALSYMQEYNIKDSEILEEVYVALLPWMGNMHPNLSTMLEIECCPFCGSTDFKAIKGNYTTQFNKYGLNRCNHCGGVFRDRKALQILKPVFSTIAR